MKTLTVRRERTFRLSALAAASALLLSRLASADPVWTVTILGPSGNPNVQHAFALSSGMGQQVGYTTPNGVNQPQACMWTGSAGSFVSLHPSGADWSQVNGVSQIQQVGTVTPVGGQQQAAVWTGTSSWTNITPSISSGISAATGAHGAQICGWATIGIYYCAGYWTSTDPNSFVNLMPVGGSSSQAFATDGAHQVGICAGPLVEYTHAALWTGTAESMVDLNFDDSYYSWCLGVSGNQQVGYANSLDGSAGDRAALWSGTPESHIDLNPAGSSRSMAYGVYNGFQAGWAIVGPYYAHAMVWTGTAASAFDLQTLLPSQYFTSEARSIVGDGTTITVTGDAYNVITGTYDAVMWTRADPSPPACPADVNHDGSINTIDLGTLLGSFGHSVTPYHGGDVNGDGVVNTIDLGIVLGKFGTRC